MWILGATVSAALLLGTAVCPTDPVLASSVVTGKPAEEGLPARNRQILSLESGANDGLALPFVLVAIAVAGPMTAGEAVTEMLWQVLGAVALGAVAGWLGGRALRLGQAHGAAAHGPMLLLTILLALLVLGLSGIWHLDGVLTAFIAGLAFNRTSTGGERKVEVELDEAVNRFVVLPFFVLIGATIPWAVWQELGWPAVVLALAVLLFRRLPVLLLLKRPLGLGWADATFLGWFGPIGVSAVFYLILEAKEVGASDTVTGAGIMIVVASTVVHGLTSSPGRVLYQRVTSPRRQHAPELDATVAPR
jgi:NhaP-type Na+/H+ or K+/H+ antiporter